MKKTIEMTSLGTEALHVYQSEFQRKNGIHPNNSGVHSWVEWQLDLRDI